MSDSQPVPTRTPEVLTAEQQLLKQRDDLRGLCDPDCEGRCVVCPLQWVENATSVLKEVESLRFAYRQSLPFLDWGNKYLDGGRWGGHDITDAIKTELIERDAECKSLRTALAQRTHELENVECTLERRQNEIAGLREILAGRVAKLIPEEGGGIGHVTYGHVFKHLEQRAEQAEAALAQAREQRDAVLRDVAKLPSPWDSEARLADPETEFAKVTCWCSWCKVRVEVETTYTKWLRAETEELAPHPDTNCLWPRALAASGRGSAPQGDT